MTLQIILNSIVLESFFSEFGLAISFVSWGLLLGIFQAFYPMGVFICAGDVNFL